MGGSWLSSWTRGMATGPDRLPTGARRSNSGASAFGPRGLWAGGPPLLSGEEGAPSQANLTSRETWEQQRHPKGDSAPGAGTGQVSFARLPLGERERERPTQFLPVRGSLDSLDHQPPRFALRGGRLKGPRHSGREGGRGYSRILDRSPGRISGGLSRNAQAGRSPRPVFGKSDPVLAKGGGGPRNPSPASSANHAFLKQKKLQLFFFFALSRSFFWGGVVVVGLRGTSNLQPSRPSSEGARCFAF